MREIDEYLKRLYKQLNANDQEIKELREEMKRHLLETVHELEAEGKSSQESIRIAIDRFGDPGMIGRELPKIIMVSRYRFSRLLLILSCSVVLLTAMIALIGFSNLNKQKELHQAELIRQEIMSELQQSQKSYQNYREIFDKTGELSAIYGKDSGRLSKKLNAEFNKEEIDQIGDMNNIFKYHNAVLMGVAVIAADTGYECPYFSDIAELGVMMLSDSSSIIELAEKAREAKTPEEKEGVRKQIEEMRKTADFSTYQQALDHNSQYSD